MKRMNRPIFRRVTLFSIVTCLFLSFASSASATFVDVTAPAQSSISDLELEIPDTTKGRLVDSEGNVFWITGHRNDTPMSVTSSTSSSNVYSVSYDYAVPKSALDHEHSVSGPDSSYYLIATLTVYYTEYTTSPAEFLLTGASATWEDPIRNDTTVVSSSATLTAMCTGIGSTAVWPDQTLTTSVTSGEHVDTEFEHAIGSAYGMMGATIELGLRRGRETWKLVLDNYPISG